MKVLLSAVGLLICLLLGAGVGSVSIAPADQLAILSHKLLGSALPERVPAVLVSILWTIRLPRVLTALLTGAALAVSGKVIDYIGEGPKFARAVYIISDRQEEISRILLYRLQRGVTALSGQGLFSGSQKQILLCVISRREVVQMKKLVQQTDPNAFVIICDAKEVLGEGFQT